MTEDEAVKPYANKWKSLAEKMGYSKDKFKVITAAAMSAVGVSLGGADEDGILLTAGMVYETYTDLVENTLCEQSEQQRVLKK